MIKTLRQWISRAIALAVLGPVCAYVAGRLVGVDGSAEHTLLTGDSFVSGVMALVIVGALTVASGVIGSVLGGRREGFLAMGFVLGWVAWTSGRVGRIYLLSPEAGTSVKLAIEGLALLVFIVLAGVLMSRADEDEPITSFSLSRLTGWLREPALLGSLGIALVASAAVSWLFGAYDFPGQSTGVGFIGGVLAGVAGALTAASMRGKDGHDGTPFAPVMIGVLLAAVVLPLVAIVYPGLGAVEELVLKGELPGTMIVSPAAWGVGALLGVPVGHSWVEHSHAQTHEHAAASK